MNKSKLIERIEGANNFSDFFALKEDILRCLKGPKKKVR